MEEHMVEECENNLRNLNIADGSESESSSSSLDSISDVEKIPWFEHLKDDCSLFYIERDADLDPFLEDALNHPNAVESASHIKQTKSKLNAAEKIKRWMKDRGKKVRNSFPMLKSNKNDSHLDSSVQLDASTHFQSKDILIDIEATRTISGCRLSFSERLFGLRLGSLNENYGICDKVSILGMLPGQDVTDIKVGDWLKSVNDIDVNLGNVEDILKALCLPSRVKLNILSPLHQMNIKSEFLPPRHNSLIKELLGDSNTLECAKLQFQHIPHGLFYLSVENGTFENDDVVYLYPDDSSPLIQLKGMFLTLGLMISDVATPPLLSCSVMVQKEIVHVGFEKENNSVMVLALPASVASVAEVQHFTTGLAKLFKYQFYSLTKAFIVDNKSCMDNFMTSFFKHYLSSLYYAQSIFSEPHLLDILPSAHWLPLPNDLKTEIDDVLSELESADFGDDSDGFYKGRRIFNIFGSCLFYKGYLLSSHLPKSDLIDIHLFLHYHHILELTQIQSVSQIIIWKEVFPSRHQLLKANDPEFEEAEGRWFILIVVMQHCVLAALLDNGGCAVKDDGDVPPELFYVEEVQNTLFILQDCGLTAATEKLLHFCVFPSVSTDLLFKSNSSRNSFSSAFASNVSIPSSGTNTYPAHYTSHSSLTDKDGTLKLSKSCSTEKLDEAKRQQLLSSIGPADGESGSESSYSYDSNENLSYFEKRIRSCSVSTGSITKSHGSYEFSQVDNEMKQLSNRNSSSLPNLNGVSSIADGIFYEKSFRMVSSFGNNLFYYLHMDPVEGVFIAPVVSDMASGTVQSNILDNFYRSCLNLRTVFERSLRNGEITKANIKTKYGVSGFLQNVYEQGVLFKCNKVDTSKQKHTLQPAYFWVIGRLFFAPEPREVYVCCLDSTAYDVVELAFRLGFGLSF